jgi:malate dehydrogenase (oxaloacetate-decarboxylating)(NADP+)
MICGTFGTTALHLHYIDQVIGLRAGVKEYGCDERLMLPGRQVFLVDTHVNYDPTAEQLAEITVMAADEMRASACCPRWRCCRIRTSARPTRRPRARCAMRSRCPAARPALEVDGEMHGDSALSAEARRMVLPRSTLTGEANLLVMPNLDAANISYNLLKTGAGHNVAIGPILLGAARPVHILTPSATVRRIVNMTALAVVDAGAQRQQALL